MCECCFERHTCMLLGSFVECSRQCDQPGDAIVPAWNDEVDAQPLVEVFLAQPAIQQADVIMPTRSHAEFESRTGESWINAPNMNFQADERWTWKRRTIGPTDIPSTRMSDTADTCRLASSSAACQAHYRQSHARLAVAMDNLQLVRYVRSQLRRLHQDDWESLVANRRMFQQWVRSVASDFLTTRPRPTLDQYRRQSAAGASSSRG